MYSCFETLFKNWKIQF